MRLVSRAERHGLISCLMHILFVAPDLFTFRGGISRQCCLTLKVLSEAQHVESIDVIALRDRPGCAPDLHYFGPRGTSYTGCGGNRRKFVQRVLAATAAKQYDLMLAGHVNLAPLLLLTGAWQRQARQVSYIYGKDAWHPLPWLRRTALQRSNRVFALSQFTGKAAIHANSLEGSRIRVVYGCLDPYLSDCEAPDEHDRHAQTTNSLLTVSRLSRHAVTKGHAAVLHALHEVVKSIPNVTYTIVGDGDMRQDLVELIESLDLVPYVRLVGEVQDSELRQLYHTCTAYVMPSKSEGFGLAFLEAMTHARPVIAGRRDGAPEVLGDAALLVEPDDWVELAQAMRSLLSSRELQAQLGSAGRARLLGHFTYERFREALLKEVDEVVAA